MVFLGEDGAHRCRHHGALARPGVGQQLLRTWNATALAGGGVQDLGHGRLEDLVCIRNHELCVAQTAARLAKLAGSRSARRAQRLLHHLPGCQ